MPCLPLRLALAATLPFAATALAEPVPDAGQLLQETRPAPSLPQREPPKIEIKGAPAEEAPGAARIHVAHLRITGATIFTEAELHALIADGEGMELTLGDLRQLAERITQHYRERGYLLTRAYLPAQEVKSGEVVIAILEGHLGAVNVNNQAEVGGAALAPLEQLRTGEVTRSETLERSLLLVSDLPGVEVSSTLRPGTTIAASDLLVDVTPGRRLTGSVDFDTFGDRFSGQNRLGGTINVNNPLQLGDQIGVRAVASDEGMAYLRGSYQAPVNSFGTRIGLAGSDMHYYLGKTLAPLQASGESQTGSLYLLHPMIRSRAFNLNAQLQYDHLRLEDRIGITSTVVDKSLGNWSAGLNGDFQDGLGGGAMNSFTLNYTHGNLELDAATQALDAITAQTEGRFGKWNASWLRLQHLTDMTILYVSASGQLASKNLDSSQKLFLGGANGVRAYPQGEASGDEGFLLTVEGRRNLGSLWSGLWQLTTFLDSGRVSLNKNPWTATNNKRTLTGAGIGLNVAAGRDWAAKADVAWRLTSATSVSDSDRRPRAWLQAAKFF